jgi:antitoxin (DNA-binding transcriptional repressor) of toxin-antitoxin stability system
MDSVTTQDIHSDPDGTLARVAGGGECLLVTRDGRPIAELRPMRHPVPSGFVLPRGINNGIEALECLSCCIASDVSVGTTADNF